MFYCYFLVVKFLSCEDGEPSEVFEPVCRKWIHIDANSSEVTCKWPPGKVTSARLQSLVHKQVNPDENWEIHPCEVISSYETYLGAHLGAKARENNPQYETEKELGIGRRRIRKRQISSSSEEQPDETRKSSKLPSPPQIKLASGSSKSFKPSAKSPLKVTVAKNKRKDKGTKASSISDIKDILKARRQKESNEVTCTSPNWRVMNEQGGGNLSKSAVPQNHSPDHDLLDPINWDTEEPMKTPDKALERDASPHTPKSVSRQLFSPSSECHFSPYRDIESLSKSQDKSQSYKKRPNDMSSTTSSGARQFFNHSSLERGGSSSHHQQDGKHSNHRRSSDSLSILDRSDKSFNPPSGTRQIFNHSSLERGGSSSHHQHTGKHTNQKHSSNSLSVLDRSADKSLNPTGHKRSDEGSSSGLHHLSISKTSKRSSESTFNDFERTVVTGMKELKEMLQVISANQSKLNLQLLPNEKVISAPEGMPSMPAKTMRDLNKLEAYLEESPDNISNVSVFLSAYVSKKLEDEHKSALRVMSHVLSNEVAAKFSLSGLKGKLKFSELKLWSAVQGAILWKCDTDLTQTKKAVGKWLADAPWRGGDMSSKPKEKKELKKKKNLIESDSE